MGLRGKWVEVATCGERILFSLVIFKFPGQSVFANAPFLSLILTALTTARFLPPFSVFTDASQH